MFLFYDLHNTVCDYNGSLSSAMQLSSAFPENSYLWPILIYVNYLPNVSHAIYTTTYDNNLEL